MGKPKSSSAVPSSGAILSNGALVPEPQSALRRRGTRMLALVLSALLAVTMLPAAGLQAGSAYADEPAAKRPATSGGDVALQSANGAGDATAAPSPLAEEREGGMLVAGGLLYTVADGGLALVGFEEGASLEGALAVPAAVSVDGRDVAIVAVDLAEGNVAEGVTALSVSQSVDNIKVDTLASAFPSLASVEVASGQGSTLPAAAGAAAMRATYSSFGGALLGQATVEVEGEGGSVESVQCRELLWAPPAAVAVRLPVDCLSLAPGALADAKNLKTIVCFGDVQRIATAERDEAGNVTSEGALTDDQLSSVTVVFPDATPVVPSEGDGRVSASMALNDGATQTDKRHAWIELGFPLERLSMGKPTGALTETVAVTEEGTPASASAQLISYPGMHPKATDVKHPDESGAIDMADNGLAYEMKSDMTLSVRWQGDPTATPSRLEIPATVAIDGVTYPVTEIAPEAFKGAVFLESISIPDGVTVIDESAFVDCVNLTEKTLSARLEKSTTLNVSSADRLLSTAQTRSIESMFEGENAQNSLDFSTSRNSSQNVSDSAATPNLIDEAMTPYAVSSDEIAVVFPTNYYKTGIITGVACTTSSFIEHDYYGLKVFTSSAFTELWYSAGYSQDNRFTFWTHSSPGVTAYSFDIYTHDDYTVLGWDMIPSGDLTYEPTKGTTCTVKRGQFLTVVPIIVPKTSQFATTSWIQSNYISNSDLNARFAECVLAADFGTISYNGIDGSDLSVFPTSYRKGGTPAIPEPKQAGREFVGWSWSRGGASGDSSNMANAFSEAGTVTLTANWGTPEADYFFAGSPLDATGAGAQSHVIKVRLSDSAGSVSNVRFEKKDTTGLVKPGREGDISFAVGSSEGSLDKTASFGGTVSGSVDLADFGDGGWGIYVKVTVPAGAIDEGSVVKSFASGDYVASFVTLKYDLA